MQTHFLVRRFHFGNGSDEVSSQHVEAVDVIGLRLHQLFEAVVRLVFGFEIPLSLN